MKKPTTIAMLLLSFAMTAAHAANNNEQPEKPRNETEICAQEAQGKSTADRYAYMKECVQRKDVEGKPSPSEDTASAKKKVCTAEAKSLPKD
jgi:flagellar biosynthesis protein FliP